MNIDDDEYDNIGLVMMMIIITIIFACETFCGFDSQLRNFISQLSYRAIKKTGDI